MPFTIDATKTCYRGGVKITSTNSHTVETAIDMSEEVADGVTDQLHAIAIDVSSLKVVAISSTVDMTVKTNSSGSAQETFSLAAGKVTMWEEGEAAIFAGDVTALYVTNASGEGGFLNVMVGMDA